MKELLEQILELNKMMLVELKAIRACLERSEEKGKEAIAESEAMKKNMMEMVGQIPGLAKMFGNAG